MFKHHPPNDEDHLENQSTDVPRRCMTLEAKEAEDKHLLLVHQRETTDCLNQHRNTIFFSNRTEQMNLEIELELYSKFLV